MTSEMKTTIENAVREAIKWAAHYPETDSDSIHVLLFDDGTIDTRNLSQNTWYRNASTLYSAKPSAWTYQQYPNYAEPKDDAEMDAWIDEMLSNADTASVVDDAIAEAIAYYEELQG